MIYPLVTIAIPTYNRADSYLRQALECAINQTYQNLEIIVSDNCSSDHTETLVKSFDDQRIKYIKHSENIGPNNNFNFCVMQAQGDFFLLLQDDDLIDKDFVDVCMRAANYDTDIGIMRTGTRIIDAHGKKMRESLNRVGGLETADFFIGWFDSKTAPYLCSTLFNTKRLQEIGGFQSKHNLFQDVVAEFQLAARFGRVDIHDSKASFREHSGEMTLASRVSDWCEDSLFLLDLMCDLVPHDKKALVRREGMRFFARINYKFASKVKSPWERFTTYMMVYKRFNYRYSPLDYAFRKHSWRIRDAAQKTKRALGRVVAHGS